MIESAKLTFSRIGVHYWDGQVRNSAIFMPRIVLHIKGRKAGKTGYLVPKRFDKKDFFAEKTANFACMTSLTMLSESEH